MDNETMPCPKCEGTMSQDGDMMKCDNCGHSMKMDSAGDEMEEGSDDAI
jgi:exosome complex RNA-binding protein Csl4